MRILTVRQPWTWAIVHGGKDVENRTANIAGDYRGPVAIHAGKRFDDAAVSGQCVPLNEVVRAHNATNTDPLTGAPWFHHMGTIIGVVDLVDVHFSGMECGRVPEGTCHEYGLCSPWGEEYQHHLVLENPRPLAMPIPHKGALGLRTVASELETQIWQGVRDDR